MKVEQLENGKFKIFFEVDAENWGKALNASYNRNKGKLRVQGFRNGKAPRKVIEMYYGKEIFYEDAMNSVLEGAYLKAEKESGLKIVSRPEFQVEQVTDETGVVFSASVYTKPVIELPEYKGLRYKKADGQVTEEEILNEIMEEREKNSRIISVTDRPVMEGDTVLVDYEGTVDGKAFEEGTANNLAVSVGSGDAITELGRHLINAWPGSEVTALVTLPDSYRAELAGKQAVFKINVKEIQVKELPELDDEFAKDVSEFDTMEEYRSSIAEKLVKAKGDTEFQEMHYQLLSQLMDATDFGNIPDPMVDMEIDAKLVSLEEDLRTKGLTLDVYLSRLSVDISTLRDALRSDCEVTVKARLLLEAIAEKENITIPSEELEAEISHLYSGGSAMLPGVKLEISEDARADLEDTMRVKAALRFIADNAVEESEENTENNEEEVL
ncbi:MAG: trigger factor [Syntrophomonadaceae bacterium]|jgi:trigger factor|nr:trigger factor [Syntrophomonadaceae bacterium]